MLFHLDRGLVGVLGMLIASTRFRGLMTMPSAARATAIMRSMQTGHPRALTGTRAESRCALGTAYRQGRWVRTGLPHYRAADAESRHNSLPCRRRISFRTSGGDLPSSTVTGPRDDGLVYGDGRAGEDGFLAVRRERLTASVRWRKRQVFVHRADGG